MKRFLGIIKLLLALFKKSDPAIIPDKDEEMPEEPHDPPAEVTSFPPLEEEE